MGVMKLQGLGKKLELETWRDTLSLNKRLMMIACTLT